MKLGIDARLISQTGVGVYTRNLLRYLQDFIPHDWEVNVYLKQKDFDSFGGARRFVRKPADIHWHTFSEQTSFYNILMKDKLDLMHFTYFSYPVLYRRSFISTIHDLTPLLYKTGKASTRNTVLYEAKHLGLRFVLNQVMKRSRGIITPSEAVKREIIENYGSKYASKVHAIHEGIDETIMGVEPSADFGKTMPKEFFLYVGNFYPHKNVQKLVDAFSLVDTNAPLILVGPEDYFTMRIKKYISESNLQKKIKVMTKVKREDTGYLYKNAKALIHPSLAEGFGLTLLEAAFFGAPVIASDIPVIREMLGNEYVSFDPLFTTDITEKIQHFIDKKPTFDYKSVVKKYSFERMAKETVEVYKKVLNNK